MSVPKKRQTSSRRNIRRAKLKVEPRALVSCAKCKKRIPAHKACPHCGSYKGKEVMKVRVPKNLRGKKSQKEDK